ncbi:MAG TPA: hypothetical protein VF510_21535 [Ktedonobacterales bacterium]
MQAFPGLSGSKAEGLLALRALHYTERFLRETILAQLFASRDPLAVMRRVKLVALTPLLLDALMQS